MSDEKECDPYSDDCMGCDKDPDTCRNLCGDRVPPCAHYNKHQDSCDARDEGKASACVYVPDAWDRLAVTENELQKALGRIAELQDEIDFLIMRNRTKIGSSDDEMKYRAIEEKHMKRWKNSSQGENGMK